MKKYQKAALLLTIFFSVFYALHILLNVDFPYAYLESHTWAEKLYAFLAGACGFLNLLLFKKEDE